MIPDYLNSEEEILKALDSIESGMAFDDIIAMTLSLEMDKITKGQYSNANANSDKLDAIPGANKNETKNKNPSHKGGKTTLIASSVDLKFYFNPHEMNTKELTIELKPNDQINYIFITDALGKIWYEKEIDQFQQILKIDASHFQTGIYNILIENDGSFSAKRFIKTK